jgi:hypothetical protein
LLREAFCLSAMVEHIQIAQSGKGFYHCRVQAKRSDVRSSQPRRL